MPRKQAFPKSPANQVFGHPLRVGLYARVSTHDQQTLPLQIRAMREYAFKRGWTIVAQIKEVGSGASQRELRTTLIAAARRREVDVVLVWRLDRWGRSVADLVSTLQELQHLGVGFVSLTEALDLTTPAGRAMAGLLASLAWRSLFFTRSDRDSGGAIIVVIAAAALLSVVAVIVGPIMQFSLSRSRESLAGACSVDQ